MKKTLVSLFTLVALAVSIQTTQAASFCPIVSPACPVVTPCTCPTNRAPRCDKCDKCKSGCANGIKNPKGKCTWWKIFEDKTCCYKCNNECDSCLSAKRAHWYKFWTDRCVVKNTKCDDCKKPCE